MCSFIAGIWQSRRYVIGWLTPVIWAPLLTYNSKEINCAYVGLIMITYWFLEIIPIPVTALIPLVLFPMVGVMESKEICRCYFNVTLMVFMGSLVAATAVEKSSLHIRMALKVIMVFGCSPRRLLLGFMLTTGFFSLWISNMAAVALMIPIVEAAMEKLANRNYKKGKGGGKAAAAGLAIPGRAAMSEVEHIKLRKGILLGVCYASNIGGTGTLTGTATNLVLNAMLRDRQISYAQWLMFNFPGVWIIIFLLWMFMCVYYLNMKTYKGQEETQEEIRAGIKIQYKDLGPMRFAEKAVCGLFAIMLFLWFFREPDFIPGWTDAFTEDTAYIKDQVPAIFVCILFFMIPQDPWNLRKSPALLDWKTAQEGVSWGVIILIGGGFALATGCKKSGLSLMVSQMFGHMSTNIPVPMMCFLLIVAAALITECTSNAATCTILLPVVEPLATNMEVDPIYFMLPITIACSYATMLPVASGTNAIVFELAQMRNQDMIIPGFIAKMICIAVLYLILHTWGFLVFGF